MSQKLRLAYITISLAYIIIAFVDINLAFAVASGLLGSDARESDVALKYSQYPLIFPASSHMYLFMKVAMSWQRPLYLLSPVDLYRSPRAIASMALLDPLIHVLRTPELKESAPAPNPPTKKYCIMALMRASARVMYSSFCVAWYNRENARSARAWVSKWYPDVSLQESL